MQPRRSRRIAPTPEPDKGAEEHDIASDDDATSDGDLTVISLPSSDSEDEYAETDASSSDVEDDEGEPDQEDEEEEIPLRRNKRPRVGRLPFEDGEEEEEKKEEQPGADAESDGEGKEEVEEEEEESAESTTDGDDDNDEGILSSRSDTPVSQVELSDDSEDEESCVGLYKELDVDPEEQARYHGKRLVEGMEYAEEELEYLDVPPSDRWRYRLGAEGIATEAKRLGIPVLPFREWRAEFPEITPEGEWCDIVKGALRPALHDAIINDDGDAFLGSVEATDFLLRPVGCTLLHVAAYRGAPKVTKVLLSPPFRDKIDVNARDDDGYTALEAASIAMACEVAWHILKHPGLTRIGFVAQGLAAGDRNFRMMSAFMLQEQPLGMDEEYYRAEGFSRVYFHAVTREHASAEGSKGRDRRMTQLLRLFWTRPALTRHVLASRIRRLGSHITALFSLIMFLMEGYLRVCAVSGRQRHGKPERFFLIASRLPLELQMMLCRRAYGKGGHVIRARDTDAGVAYLAYKTRVAETTPQEYPRTWEFVERLHLLSEQE